MDSYEWIAPLAGFLLVITAPAPAQQPDTIRVGSPSLRGAALAPGSYTIVSVRRAEGKDTPNSTTRITIMRAGTGADEVYLIQSIHASAAGDTTIGAITARASDFALVHHRVKGVHDSTAVAAADGFVTGWVVLRWSGGARRWDDRHKLALVMGVLAFFIIFGGLQDFEEEFGGHVIVAILTVAGLWRLWRITLRRVVATAIPDAATT